ncbi:MAG: hypothetical protein K5989_00710 [Lachnospiraceae bacterium]|nr:hypothetical protein [Lachnospiraceae bacterium]
MLEILLVWFYITVSFLLNGLLIQKILDRLFKDIAFRNNTHILIKPILIGMVGVSLYAEFFSLFAGVNLLANLILILETLLLAIILRKDLRDLFSLLRSRVGFAELALACVSICILALISAGTTNLGDAYEYHMQAIRWNIEYGMVPGEAQVISRLGFNSSIHLLNALFGLEFMAGIPIHGVTGYYLLLLCLSSLDLLWHVFFGAEGRKLSFSSFFAFACLSYVFLGTAWISSPITDIPCMSMVFLVILYWMQLLERDENRPYPYILLCMLALYASTIKFSSVIIFLLSLYPIYLLIKSGKIRQILYSAGVCIFIYLPFLIRNVVLTGWLLYPFQYLDFFSPDWKLSKEVLEFETFLVTDYGRNPLRLEYEVSWLQAWIPSLSLLKKIIIVCVLVFLLLELGLLVLKIKEKLVRGRWLFFEAVMFIGLAFWFITAPDVRFGWPYLLFFLSFVPVNLGHYLRNKPDRFLRFMFRFSVLSGLGVLSLISLFYIYRSAKLVMDGIPANLVTETNYDESYRILGKGEGSTVKVGNTDFYITLWPGYTHFPSADKDDFIMRGESLRDGFRADDKD